MRQNYLLALAALLIAPGISTQVLMAQDEMTPEEINATKVYKLNQPETPQHIERYSRTAYTAGLNNVATFRGDVLHNGKDTIKNFAINPAGSNFALISKNKKNARKLEFYSSSSVELKLESFNVKKYGIPTAVAYTPDARKIAVATDKGIYLLESRKFSPYDKIDLVPVNPTAMTMSPNGFYLALMDGSKVVVYNFEEKKIRQRWDFEVPVTDIVFSQDSKLFGVLTNDGLLTIYDTRKFDLNTTVDDLGEGIAFDFNDNGKYVAVVTSPEEIAVVNLLKQSDRKIFEVETGKAKDIAILYDSYGTPLLTNGTDNKIMSRRLNHLEPYYGKLVSDEVDLKMADWLKMQPGETMDAYKARVNEESISNQRRLFEDEISTTLAGDLLSMSAMTLGAYNKDKELLTVDFSNMPQIYLPVPQADITSFHTADDLTITDAQYGVLPDDSFELIYAKFNNKNDGKTYVYDNLDRVPMTMLDSGDNMVSLEVLQQQQMEEMKLQEIKEKVIAEAKHDNVISDHTHITVDSRVAPDYDANGEKILNYIVNFTYEVEPSFSAIEDFGPGKYKIGESGAASSMLNIVKQAFESDFAQYIADGKKLVVNISGSADASPIVRGIPYDGCYGDFEEEPIRQNGELAGITVTKAGGIKTNEQLAFLRAISVKDYLEKNLPGLVKMNREYNYNIGVSNDKGSEFRRITAEFTFYDVY